MKKEQSIEDKYKEQMYQIAKAIDHYLNPDGIKLNGFALLVFPFGQSDGSHRSNYLSNANREDMLAIMKEFIAWAEGRIYEKP